MKKTTEKICEGKCPNCNKELFTYGTADVSESVVSYLFTCNECGTRGYEYFDMHYAQTEIIEDEEDEEDEENEREMMHGARLREEGISSDYYENGDEYDEGDSSYDEHYNR